MSSITRKNKRRAAFKCAKQGIAPAQAIAVSAAREIKATKEATAEIGFRPQIGVISETCPCKSACHKACAHYLRRRLYQQTTCPKNNLPHTLQIHSASGAAQFHSKSFMQ